MFLYSIAKEEEMQSLSPIVLTFLRSQFYSKQLPHKIFALIINICNENYICFARHIFASALIFHGHQESILSSILKYPQFLFQIISIDPSFTLCTLLCLFQI